MSFAENLKQMRKEKGLSQEDLAGLLEVSRQAVSKWELGDGYPEVEKLLLLSQKLSVSLDCLLDIEVQKENTREHDGLNDEIVITSPTENAVIKCSKVISSQKFKGGEKSPKYALYGVSGSSAFGDNSTLLGWYADDESISKEISEIQKAIDAGVTSYALKFSVKTKLCWGSVRILE